MTYLWSLSTNNRGSRAKVWAAGVLGLLLIGSVSPGATPQAEAAFPGRNGLIAFPVLNEPALGPVLYDTDLFTVPSGGAAIRQLTSGPETDFWPAWSPDGQQISFARALQISLASDIYVMGADGAGIRALTQTPELEEWAPSWSPDGEQVVFVRSLFQTGPVGTGGSDLYVMTINGGSVHQLTDGPGYEWTPAWSPDGEWIAYTEDCCSNARTHIAAISSDGSRKKRLTRPGDFPGKTAQAPTWSPDGRWLAFVTARTTSSAPVDGDIWVIRADGTGRRNLTNTSHLHESAPAWSPDGKLIAFVSEGAGPRGAIYQMSVDGSDLTRLVNIDLLPSGNVRLDWGPRP